MFDYQPPDDLLKDRIILVTGAGDGIGRAAALSYAAHGATVILLGRTVEKLEQVYDEIEAAGGPQPAIFPMDLEAAEDGPYAELAGGIDSEFGQLHGILHNAGILGSRVPLQSYPLETWNKVLQVNLNAAFAITKHCLPLLHRAGDASVVFTSSGVGRQVRAYWGAYSIAKYATEGLMMLFHEELENTSSIRVNTVNPGGTATRMRKQAYPAENPANLPGPQDIMSVYLYLMGADSRDERGRQFDAQ